MSRLGFHTIHYSPMFGASAPLLEVIRHTAAAGFDAIGVDQASVQAHGSVDDIGATIADAGLQCSDVLVLLPGGDDDLPGTARQLGRLAPSLRAPACIAGSRGAVAASRLLVAALDDCASILSDHGCRLALEFTPCSALASLSDAVAVCGAVGWDRCGLALDALHFFRSGSPVGGGWPP